MGYLKDKVREQEKAGAVCLIGRAIAHKNIPSPNQF